MRRTRNKQQWRLGDKGYYGEAGSCALCEGEHKVVKDNNCVCDDGFEDDGNGGCKEKTTSLTCGEHQVESNGTCVCDTGYEDDGNGRCKEKDVKCSENEKAIDDGCICDGDKGYYGEAGSCELCEGENKVVKDKNCVCEDELEDDGNG